ncbi:MAG: FkbM family methyltransferase [Actinomycetota bacterium]|nr:FkbM family methyltransferase [Actinomycetota bacterium]MDP2287465.1 FkbM family methyltransferase [Actinomycetota bacterium]
MVTFTRIQRGLRVRAARWLQPAPPPSPAETAYYPQQPSCQIPELWFILERLLGRRETGYFVEVGAYDGVFVSNTWGLAVRGWQGLMLEPVPAMAAQCRANHGGHPRVQVVERAIGLAGVDEVRLHIAGTLTTANAEALHEYEDLDWAQGSLTTEQIVVPCSTLDEVLVEFDVPVGFDVLVVDVEGFETEVFSGVDLDAWKPKLLIVELADMHPDLSLTAAKDAQLGEMFLAKGYRIVFKDHVNTVLVREEIWRQLFS